MVDRFVERLRAADGTPHVVADLTAARALAAELVAGATTAGWVEGIGRPAAPDAAEVSLVTADVGVAFSGAVGWAHGPGRSRSAGLLPDRQIVLLDRAHLVGTLGEALRRLDPPPASFVLVAGPSRTADIEQRMMLGVHGPRSLDVILFG